MRNKAMQARYDTWMAGMKAKYGSTGESAVGCALGGHPCLHTRPDLVG